MQFSLPFPIVRYFLHAQAGYSMENLINYLKWKFWWVYERYLLEHTYQSLYEIGLSAPTFIKYLQLESLKQNTSIKNIAPDSRRWYYETKMYPSFVSFCGIRMRHMHMREKSLDNNNNSDGDRYIFWLVLFTLYH